MRTEKMVSLSDFDGICKELLWHRDRYEHNFQKAVAAAQSQEDVDTLRSNIHRWRSILDTFEQSVNGLEMHWDSTNRRKSSVRSVPELLSSNGVFFPSNSSSERSSNGSPFQNGFHTQEMGTSFSTLSLGSEDIYDGYRQDILNQLFDENVGEPQSIPYIGNLGFEFQPQVPAFTNEVTVIPDSWPKSPWSSPVTTSSAVDLFPPQVFTSEQQFIHVQPKPSFASIAQQSPAPAPAPSFASIAKKPAAEPAKTSPRISEKPVLTQVQKPPLPKVAYVFPLSFKIDEAILEKYFRQFGRVAKAKIFRYPNGESKTAGCVEFEEASSAAAAVKKKQHTIEGCEITVEYFQPKNTLMERAPSKGVVSRSNHFVNNTEYQVFIGGIPVSATDEEVEKAITHFGKVKRIQINPNGTYAFVAFASDSDANKIVSAHNVNIAGKLVECKRNQPARGKENQPHASKKAS